MRRVRIPERADWRATAIANGFDFHTIDGAPYWDETAYWSFTLKEIERDIELPSIAINEMCLALVDEALRDETILRRLAIPEFFWDEMRRSWEEDEATLYGRLDLAYSGDGPAKLLEYNADTPTALYETGFFQWRWLEERMADGTLPKGCDQFNSVHERLIARLGEIAHNRPLHLTSVGPDVDGHVEDRGTTAYIEDCARQAGLEARWLPIDSVGLTRDGRFVDAENTAIALMFKLYPWEWLLAEPFGKSIPGCGVQFLEPPWKLILSNKGLLPLLWARHPGHPNLLPAFFDDDPRAAELGSSFARKPLYSREGANVTLTRDGALIDSDDGPYGREGFVRQALARIAAVDGNHAVLGSWIVGDLACGLGMREDASPITKNTSRFVPHALFG